MFDTVLLPIDLNHPASWERALPMARKMCGDSGTLHVLGVVHDLGAAMVASYLPEGFEKDALRAAKTRLDAFAAEHGGAKAVAHVAHGHVAERILSVADQVGADVIVMASHPPDDLGSILVASNAGRVVRHSHRPVLVVR